jgi:hypothetical protein
MGSFDATGSSCITTKTGVERMARPNGSTDGLIALSRSIDGGAWVSAFAGATCDRNTIKPELPTIAGNMTSILDYVDMARSSSSPGSLYTGSPSTYTTPTLAYIPFGRDAFAYAYHKDSNAAYSQGFTILELRSFYNCSVRSYGGQTITPVIPQAGSGSRSAFLSKIGVEDDATFPTVGKTNGCVVEGQEHDGRTLTVPNSIMPMSVSRWVAMANGLSVNRVGNAVLGSLIPGESPVTVVDNVTVPNEDYYYDDTWGRETWIGVSFNRITLGAPGYDVNLATVLDPAVSSSLVNTDTSRATAAGSIKKQYGILPPKAGTTVKRGNLLANK